MTNRGTDEQNEPRQPQRGQATIEFVLVLFFLLVPLLIGLADVARAYSEHLAVVHAANLGARWATLSQDQQTCSGFGSLEDVVQSDLPAHLRDPSQHSIATATPTVGGLQSVEVTITYKHTLLFGLAPSVEFAAKSVMPGPVSDSTGQTCPTFTPTYTPTGPPPTFTRTFTPTRTRTVTPTVPTSTRTYTPVHTSTPTNTSTPTYTRTATITPTPTVVCPYQVTPLAYKNEGLNAAVVHVTVLDSIGRPVQGLGVTVTVVRGSGHTQSGTTDASGFVCFPFGSLPGGTLDVIVDVTGPHCPPEHREISTSDTPVLTCP
jgi:hypothetical protein